MTPLVRRTVALLAAWMLLTFQFPAAAQLEFAVTLPPGEPSYTGRLVVFIVATDSRVARKNPADGPFWTDPQPLFGADVKGGQPGDIVTIGPETAFPEAFPAPSAHVPAGSYKAQAVLDLTRVGSSFGREAGNRIGEPVTFEVRPDEPVHVELDLTDVVDTQAFPDRAGVTEMSVASALLSDFHSRPVMLKAGVLKPIGYDPNQSYAAVYVIPVFGGRHDEVTHYARRTAGGWSQLRRRAFVIVLDPESPNGHTLFCDSRVNGPFARALIEELVPALEEKYPLIPAPWARIVTGHSSGGWSSLWLGTQYPETFGSCWSSGPDPVDFRRFELVDIYTDDNAYVKGNREIPAARYLVDGEMTEAMTVREENGGEGVLGPLNTSGQQWDSWMACWGTLDQVNPRVQPDGWPVAKPLFDAETGVIDRAEAELYKAYDIRLLLADDPQRYLPIFRNNVRLVCGSLDNYYLNEAVELLKAELDRHPDDGETAGYIKIVAGADHGASLFISSAMLAWPGEMVAHLKQHGGE